MEIHTATTGLGALAHEARLRQFRRLVQAGPAGMSVGDLTQASGANLTTVSAQLAVLQGAGLVTSRRQGRSIIYAADYGAIGSLIAFLMEDCCQRRPEILATLNATDNHEPTGNHEPKGTP